MSNIFGSQKFQKTIQLALIVAVLVSTFAFLPYPVAAGQKGTLIARVENGKVTISGENFNKNRDFIVNAKSGKTNSAKLGTVKSNDTGVLTRTTFSLPTNLKSTRPLTVCVKDIKNNKRTCTTIK
jgi:hypothetical protein